MLCAGTELPGQTKTSLVEPGLEDAVKWKWRPEESDRSDWGFRVALPAETQEVGDGKNQPSIRIATGPPDQALDYEVARGDALVKIGRRFGVSVDQLKYANKLETDLIVVGQKLRIPSRAEIEEMPVFKKAVAVNEGDAGKGRGEKQVVYIPKYSRPLNPAAQRMMAVVAKQAMLDRNLFSCGPIDGLSGGMFLAATAAFEAAYPGELQWKRGRTPASMQEIGGAYREYVLREEDFRWIEKDWGAKSRSGRSRSSSLVDDPEPEWKDLEGRDFLPYWSAWEFVAERFHCAEGFLRSINTAIKGTPKAGTMFLVPNVEPFEIERAFEQPIRPIADPAALVKAKIIGNAWLEVWKGESLEARVPVSSARPGLRGRGTWWILDSIPRPRLVCTGELSNPPKFKPGEDAGGDEVVAAPPVKPDWVLAPGPNNPVGLFWVHLSKSGDGSLLPYGLHGTSIPGTMGRQESLGGFRLSNWDMDRVIRLLPIGTELKWE